MAAAALCALLLSAAPRLEGAASAGGGYDSNPNHGDQSLSELGAGFAALRASGGASLDVGGTTNVYGGLRFDDEEYPSYPDLTTRAASVELSLVQDLGARAAFVATPWLAWSWSGDPARNATTLGAQLTLRVKPTRDVALRASGGLRNRDAAEAVFSSVAYRVGASAEWRILARTYLSAAASVERGDEVFYRAVPTGGGGPGMGGGRPGQAAAAEEPYTQKATTLAIGPSLEVGLGSGFYAVGSYEVRWVASDTTDLRTQSVFAGVGARL